MSILDEIENHALRTERLNKSINRAQRNAEYFRKLESRIPIFKIVAIVSALIPAVGWGILLALFLAVNVLINGGKMDESLGNSIMAGVMYGVFTGLVTFITNTFGLDNAYSIELTIFYAIAAVLVFFVFSGCRTIKKMAKITRDAAEQIASQQ
jgi:hypothetical protein